MMIIGQGMKLEFVEHVCKWSTWPSNLFFNLSEVSRKGGYCNFNISPKLVDEALTDGA